MKIVYGIHGFGRGHAMRARSVLPELCRRHDMLILAGGDAYRALCDDFPVTRIPTLGYYYNRRGRISVIQTLKRSGPMTSDAFCKGSIFCMIEDMISDFGPDIVLSDSEIYTHRAAAHLSIPRITFDHYAVLVYCKLPLGLRDRIACRGSAMVYKRLYGEPQRVIASAFFDAPAKKEGVRVVGAAIRREVRETEPTNGDHLLVYLSKTHDYSPQLEAAISAQDMPVIVYGMPPRPKSGNLEFKPLNNLTFIRDVASCRAVYATTGNQLCGEVLHFGKPMMGQPMNCVEQRLNARKIEEMGFGVQVQQGKITAEMLRSFLNRTDAYAGRAKQHARDGAAEALAAIEQYGKELIAGKPVERPGETAAA